MNYPTINDGFYESVQSLDSLAIKGYELYGYSEGISSLELANKVYQSNLESYTNLRCSWSIKRYRSNLYYG